MSNLFPTTLLGYSKKAVNDYLAKRSEEFRSILERMDNELSSYRDEFLQIQTDKLTSSQENKELYAQEVEEL